MVNYSKLLYSLEGCHNPTRGEVIRNIYYYVSTIILCNDLYLNCFFEMFLNEKKCEWFSKNIQNIILL